MPGYIINYYKYLAGPSEMKSSLLEYTDNRGHSESGPASVNCSRIVFGDFDRVSIEKIDDFSRLRNIEQYAQEWIGARQSLLLFCLNNSKDPCEKLPERRNSLLDVMLPGKECKCNFACITLITLSSKLLGADDFHSALNICKELINQQIQRVINDRNCDEVLFDSKSVKWDVYGSFSSSELAIVWIANEYSDILRLVDILRDVEFKIGDTEHYHPFLSFYSIIMQPYGHHNSEYERIHGIAEIQFLLQDPGDDDNALEAEYFYRNRAKYFRDLAMYFKERCEQGSGAGNRAGNEGDIKVLGCVGANDIVLRLPAYLLCKPGHRVFESDGVLYYKNKDMTKYVSSSYTQLYYDTLPESKIQRHLIEFSSPGLQICREPKSISAWIDEICKKVYGKKGLRNLIKDTFPSTVGLCDTLDLLYTDYVNNCTNLSSTAWAFDFSAQFAAVLNYIEAQILRYNNTNAVGDGHIKYMRKLYSEELYSTIKNIFNDFSQIIYHVAHSRRTVFVIPSCHLRYMGQFDMILHAYYGLEKRFLEMVYKHQKEDQTLLTPIFTIDLVPDIRTNMYKYYIFDEKTNEDKRTVYGIFSINMPLSSLTDFQYYSMVICHETFHFIAPPDRNKRNQIMGMLYFASFVASAIIYPLGRQIEDPQAKNIKIDLPVLKGVVSHLYIEITMLMFDKLREQFMEIHSDIGKEDDSSKDGIPVWNEYCRELINKLKEKLVDEDIGNLNARIYQVLCALTRGDDGAILQEIIDKKLCEIATRLVRVNLCDEDIAKIKCMLITPFDVNDSSADLGFKRYNLNIRGMLESQSVSDIFELADDLSTGYREACQDLSIIDIYGLSLEDYFVFRDRHMRDILYENREIPQSEFFREVFICDFMLRKLKDTNEPRALRSCMKSTISGRYRELMSALAYETTDENRQKSTQYIIDTFQQHIKRYEKYTDDYARIRQLFQILLDEVSTNICSISRGVRNYLTASYEAWKKVELDFLREAEQIKERADAENKRRQRLFDHNIKMIMHFQSQTSLQDIQDSY